MVYGGGLLDVGPQHDVGPALLTQKLAIVINIVAKREDQAIVADTLLFLLILNQQIEIVVVGAQHAF